MNIKIKSAKLLKDGEFTVNYSKSFEPGKVTEVTETEKEISLPELRKALDDLRCHYGFLTGYLEKDERTFADLEQDAELMSKFYVSGWSNSEKKNGYVLTGNHTLANGKVVTVNTPFESSDEEAANSYTWIRDLNEKIKVAHDLVMKFLNGRKSPQLEIPLPDQEDDGKVKKLVIDHPEEMYSGVR